MPRKVLVLTLISLLVLSVSVFGAMKPKVDDIMRKRLERMENQNYPDESIVTRYVTTPAPKLLEPLPSNVAGFTYYDYQHNDVMRRMIANGTDMYSTIHVTWMDLPSPPIGEERYVDYNSYPPWLAINGMHVTPEGARGGYTGMDLLPDQREVLCYHRTQPATPPLFWGTAISIETGDPGTGTFASYDIPDAVQGQPEDLKGEWPTVACAKVPGAHDYIHITHAEGQTSGSVDKAMYYLRCYESGAGQLTCESPGWVAPLVINSNNKLAPNKVCYQYDKCRLGTGVIATSPVSQKVAIVYFKNYAASQTQNELMYIESPGNGQNWITTPAAMVPVQLTNYQAGGGLDRAYDDIAAIYDYNDNLHIVWTTFKSTNSNDVTLWHWTAAQGVRIAGFATASSATDPGAWNLLIAKFTLGIYQPDQTLYLNYTKFQDGDTSAGGYANGDICAKGSTNFGLTWGPEVNMTNTNTNGCAAGSCASEHWSSLAERVDDFLHVEYIADLDPAGFSTPEGAAENDTVIYLKYLRFTITPAAVKVFSPTQFVKPHIWAKNGQDTQRMIRFYNPGTYKLRVRLSGPTWLTINPAVFEIGEGAAPQDVLLTFQGVGHTDEFLTGQLMIESNNGTGQDNYIDIEYVKIHFVVTDNFYYPEWAKCIKGPHLAISNVGNLGHQDDSAGMFYNGHNYLFEATPVFVTPNIDSSGPIGFTWLHNHEDFIAEDSLRMISYPNLAANVYFDKFGLVFPPRHPWHHLYHWWWSYWTKWSKVINVDVIHLPDSTWLHLVRVKNWWTWNPPPIWWTPLTGSENPAPGYFGFAGDWDVPAEASGRNLGGYVDSLNLIYQYSDSAGFTNYYGGFQFLRAFVVKGGDTSEYTKPFGAHVLANSTQLYPWNGYNDDSLFKYMSTPGYSIESDSSQDMNIVVSAVPEVTDPDSTTVVGIEYALLVTDQGLTALTKMADANKRVKPGDANVDGKVSVSDVVYEINYLFKGGPIPCVNCPC